MRKDSIALAALAAALVPAGFGMPIYPGAANAALPLRRSGYRKGRRFNRFGQRIVPPGGNPAGTKLAKLAAKGLIGISRIR
jgi:hypothetical protein